MVQVNSLPPNVSDVSTRGSATDLQSGPVKEWQGQLAQAQSSAQPAAPSAASQGALSKDKLHGLADGINAQRDTSSVTRSQPQYNPVHSLLDARDPGPMGRQLGSDVVVTSPISKDSPVLPGGKIVTTLRNVPPGPVTPESLANIPRSDSRFFDAKGHAEGYVRVNPQTNNVQGNVHLGDGKKDLVFGGNVTPSNGSANAVSVTGYSGKLGLRLVVTNPGNALGATGKPAAQTVRGEAMVTTGGHVVPVAGELRKPFEAYVFVQDSHTGNSASPGKPSNAASTQSGGAGVRYNAININPKGAVPITGDARIEVSETKAPTQKNSGAGVSVNVDVVVGKPNGLHGLVQGNVTQPTHGPTSWGVSAGPEYRF